MRPRRALISAYFDPALPGGGSQYSVDMVREWIRRGMNVHVLCSDHPRKLTDLEPHVKTGQLVLYPLVNADQLLLSHRYDPQLQTHTARILKEINPESIHIHNFHGMLGAVWAAVESGIKTVYTALDFGLICPSWYLYDGSTTSCSGPEAAKCQACMSRQLPIPWEKRLLGYAPDVLAKAFGKKSGYFKQYAMLPKYYGETSDYLPRMHSLLKRFDVVLTISPVASRILRQFGVPEERIHLSVQGADFPLPLSAEASEHLRLIFLGHVAPIKGFHVIVKAAAQLPDNLNLEIRMYVSDPQRVIDQLPVAARRYIKPLKTINGTEVEMELAAADALVIPSLWHENTPYAVLRALAAGRPVISSNQEGIAHLIADGKNGFLLPAGDVQAWTTLLHRLALNPVELRDMRRECHYQKSVKDYADEVEQAISLREKANHG